MKKLILITGILLSTNAWADMKPLLDYLDDDYTNKDLSNIRLLCYKCFYLLKMDRLGVDVPASVKSKIIKKDSEKRNQMLLETSFRLWDLLNEDKSIEAFQQSINLTVPSLSDKYLIIANENYLNNGSYIMGNELLINDLFMCVRIVEMNE